METAEDLFNRLQAIVNAAEGRSLTDDEVAEYETVENRLKAVQKSDEIRARQSAWAAPVGQPLIAPVAPAKADNTLDLAFENYLRTGKANADIVNAQGEGTGSAGGYLVPNGFRAKLIDRMKAFGGIATVAEEVTTDTGAPLPFPTVDDTDSVGEIVQEGATFTGGSDLTFVPKELGAYTYQTGGAGGTPLRVSWDLLQDAGFDVVNLITNKLGMRLARIQATHLATGNGVGQPKGLVHGLTGIEPAADTAGITYDDLLTFIHSVDPAYRGSARWVFNDNSLKTIRQIKDSNGDPLWRSSISTMADGPGGVRLLDYPVTIDQSMPDIDIDNNSVNWGAFGDIREGYVVRRVKAVTVVVNPWSRAAYRETEFTAYARMDATQQNTNAYVALCGEQ